MNEQPKSIWRKPWQGWRGALLWFALLAIAAFVVFYLIGLIGGNDPGLLIAALIASVCIALLLVLAILFFRWISNGRNFRRFLFGVACVVTLIALFYAEENWRGRHAWKKFKTEWEAKGEKFGIAEIAPPPVPDDQNFAMTPVWVEEISAMFGFDGMRKARTWYGNKVDALGHTNFVRRLEMPVEFHGEGLEFTNGSRNWQKSEKTDLKKWQEYYRRLATVTNVFPVAPQPQTPAVAVLLALSKYDSTIEELRAASKLPYARFPLGYTDDDPASILLPHLASLKGCLRPLQLRAAAELETGQIENALDDIKLMFRLTDTIRSEPLLISHLVRIAMLNIAIQPVWEGLADRRWNETHLAALDAELAKLDILEDYKFSMRGERAFGIGIIDYIRRNRGQMGNLETEAGGFNSFLTGASSNAGTRSMFEELEKILNVASFRLIPSGWFERNKLSIAVMHRDYLLPPVNLETRTASAAAVARSSNACNNMSVTPYNLFGRLLLPALYNVPPKSARAQSAVDSARIAIALERYRLAHGNFPETLDALAPQFTEKIPHDIIGGKPLKYQRTDDGNFLLYSIGWNETDDGGKAGLTKGGNADPKQGDWVWRY